MKTKPVKRKTKKSARTSRTRIDKRIAAEKSPDVRRYIAMYGQKTPPTRIQILVSEWALVNTVRDNPKLREIELKIWEASSLASDANRAVPCPNCGGKGTIQLNSPALERFKRAEKRGSEFIRDAMLQWDAAALIALAKEMKKFSSAQKGYDLDHRRRALLACGVPTGKAAEAILEDGKVKINWLKKKDNEERQLKRIKARWRKGDS